MNSRVPDPQEPQPQHSCTWCQGTLATAGPTKAPSRQTCVSASPTPIQNICKNTDSKFLAPAAQLLTGQLADHRQGLREPAGWRKLNLPPRPAMETGHCRALLAGFAERYGSAA